MTAKELRQKYLDFFKSKGHAIISSGSLMPENDPTVLFTTAGMHPLVPYLMGENHPGGRRVVSAQKCVRTGDIDEVGDATHHTFFEMLGNWSFGDYFKQEAISWSWEFLTSPDWLNLDKSRLAVSVFAGDKDAPFDQEAHDIWLSLGVAEERIARLPKKNNWWGPAGLTGPCGPDTEMFYWSGEPDKTPAGFNDDNPLWVEIWNDVFMQYNKRADGSFEPLKQKNVDTGMGLERVVAILNGQNDNYQSDLFKHLINKIEQLSGKTYGESVEITKAMRIIADHLKAATFIMGDQRGVGPSNTDQGYVVRRLIRRAIRHGRQLGIKDGSAGLTAGESWTKEIAKVVAHDYQTTYPELPKNIDKVIEQFKIEEAKFGKTLEQGLREFAKIISELKDKKISGEQAFNLYQTYGFPLEITQELAKEKNCAVDDQACRAEMKKHQKLSRTASAGVFKGGLADASEQTTKLHTAAHLLLAALRKILGDQVVQKGSNITAERLRFDFSYAEKMTAEQKQQVEILVNRAIKQNWPVTCDQMGLSEAKTAGAHGTFESKYGEKVKVYTIGNSSAGPEPPFSREICGGPHVNNTGQLGHFKIQKEESSSAGVRRIKAVLK
ncbi:MAG: Alanine-tRNA ligase [Parcubacteria group bacterium GW2011_GWA2_44_15]|uniref:Alanine--tRNA ligase n=1 Tax=Candidatus Falkowbacteria bacterium RIFCSPHIGHO2_02_FULL_42_9 TaxID=1797986 RepID=A0A1F5SA60_9BACT|nr:MAG: Alanine-tRNA ligase [Parcubacteria group bacterium GW2011_GWA2_44_15]OGF23547.1 MAG: alanine--tRNA ligase [Candidatus Falkowbacteria bacterium RIFCSPHIGHO2_02_FULL_42_9]